MALHTVCGPGYAYHVWQSRKPSVEQPTPSDVWDTEEVVYTLPKRAVAQSVGECCLKCIPAFEAYAGHPKAQLSVSEECALGHLAIKVPSVA